jgi:hypothetical protein
VRLINLCLNPGGESDEKCHTRPKRRLLRQHFIRTGNADLIWHKGQDTLSIQATLVSSTKQGHEGVRVHVHVTAG